jgi:hypothetical protein
MIYARVCSNKTEITGQDTIAIAMTWMIKFVDENQEVLNELKVNEIFIVLSFVFTWLVLST